MTKPTVSVSVSTAQGMLASGLCVLPAWPSEKRPAINAKWEKYKSSLPSQDELNNWFSNAQEGLCLVCGTVSGNLEMIDFDFAGELFEPWCEKVNAITSALLDKLVIETSQSAGWHVCYRSAGQICGSRVLAQRKRLVNGDEITRNNANKEIVTLHGKEYLVRTDDNGSKYVLITLIETRGEGGLFLCAPTPGYELIQGELSNLPVLSEEEREILLHCAWELNEYVPEVIDGPPAPANNIYTSVENTHRPGDDFNARSDIRSLLTAHGWVCVKDGDNQYWRRPGKNKGWSATFNGQHFYVFSSNAVLFEQNRAYTPFAVYTLLEHNGDFSAATKALVAQGYGEATGTSAGVDLSNICGPSGEMQQSKNGDSDSGPAIHQLKQLIDEFEGLNPPVIHGLLREGETMNIIASPKMGKSWFVSSLAISIASGLDWLGLQVEQGRVLHIDNELHANTSAYRYGVISRAMKLTHELYSDNIDLVSLRGQLRDLYSLGQLFEKIESGHHKLVIIDAFYRTLPRDTDENDNGAIANLYNMLDRYAAGLGCAFVLIHHASKGNQSAKAVTDVGAGAGSQSRAVDTHLILRPHEQDDFIVLESAVRSWAPIKPMALRWDWPLFIPTSEVNTSDLRGIPKPKSKSNELPLEDFVEQCIAVTDPCSQRSVKYEAGQCLGMSERQTNDMLELAIERGLVSKIRTGSRMRYVKNRPGVSGDKGLWVAAILDHQPEADNQRIANEVGATDRYIRDIRAQMAVQK